MLGFLCVRHFYPALGVLSTYRRPSQYPPRVRTDPCRRVYVGCCRRLCEWRAKLYSSAPPCRAPLAATGALVPT
jgi:hypothetical protein